jgi:hypothetical protein
MFPNVDRTRRIGSRNWKFSPGLRAVHSRPPTVSILLTRRQQFMWRPARLPCYHINMQVVTRSLSLLLLAVALMLPTVARTSAHADVLLAAPASFVQSATPNQAKRMAMNCHRCFGKACGASALACGAYCGAASALTPLVVVLTLVASPAAASSVFKAPRDHGRPPDPPPPRLIAIS